MIEITSRYAVGLILATLLLSACSTAKEAVKAPVTINTKKNLDDKVVEQYKNTITSSDLKEYLYTIASDGFEGRNTASRGSMLAADYITNFYRANGLAGPLKDKANPYLQPIPFYEKKVLDAKISGNDIVLEHNRDFSAVNSANCDKIVEVVFGGYGVDLAGYNDFTNLDLRGKALVIISGEPLNSDGERLFSVSQKEFLSIEKLKAMGITDLIFTMPRQEIWDAQAPYLSYSTNLLKPVYELKESERDFMMDRSFNRFLASPSKLAELMGVTPQEYFTKVQQYLDQKKPLGGLFSAKDVNIKVGGVMGEITCNNLVAYLEGTDLKNEVLVISSHYDHVGVNDGKIYNGADDDGSGTVGVMEIAQAFGKAAKDGYRPRRSILFLNVTGEEKGLFGSAYYTDVSPVFPLANTIADLNIDMIGRVDPKHEKGGDYIYIIGSDMLSTDLHKLHERVAKKVSPALELDYLYNGKDHPERFYYRSDHYNFAKNNIPVIFYFNGTHADYHQPTDTPDKINYDLLAKRAQLIFATAWELVNVDKRPVVDKKD